MTTLVYGAYGYTGTLVVDEAKRRGEPLIVAGRDREKTTALARTTGFEARVFDLEDAKATRDGLRDVDVVLHCAGPFTITSRPMVDACLARGASYLDITGEIDVIEDVLARDDEARREGVLLVPGVGFDVVPTDCLALMLKDALPDATHLTLAFRSKGGTSRGTARTAVMSVGSGGKERRDGRIVDVPAACHVRTIPFPRGPRTAASIPWGDVASAYKTTGIPNIVTLMAMREDRAKAMERAASFAFLARSRLVQRALIALVDARVKGPDEDARKKGFVEVWGEVTNARGDRASGALVTPEGYTFTAASALLAAGRARGGAAGALTPALAFGKDFVREIAGVEVGELVVERR